MNRNCTRKITEATPTKRRNEAIEPTDARRYPRASPPITPATASFCDSGG